MFRMKLVLGSDFPDAPPKGAPQPCTCARLLLGSAGAECSVLPQVQHLWPRYMGMVKAIIQLCLRLLAGEGAP